MDRYLDEQQRITALDLLTAPAARTARFYAAAVAPALGPDERSAPEVRNLLRAVGAVLEAMTARSRKYDRAVARAHKALAVLRNAS